MDERRLLLVAGICNSASELLVELEIDEAAGTAAEVAAVDRDVPRLLCCASRPAGGVLLQQHSGSLLLYSAGGVLAPLPPAAGLPSGCPQMAAVPAEGAGTASAAAVGLTPRGQLYWGSRMLAADATSFAVRGRACFEGQVRGGVVGWECVDGAGRWAGGWVWRLLARLQGVEPHVHKLSSLQAHCAALLWAKKQQRNYFVVSFSRCAHEPLPTLCLLPCPTLP